MSYGLGVRRALALAALLALLAPFHTRALLRPGAAAPGLVSVAGTRLQRAGQRFEIRGMNYYPKDYAWDRFWTSYTTATLQIDQELALAQALGVNTARIFLPYDRFANATRTADLAHLRDLIGRLRAHEMLALITLFDYYPSYSPAPYAASDYAASQQHIDAVVDTVGVTNTAVLGWDLKNEIDRDYACYTKSAVAAWAQQMLGHLRQRDPNHLITVGVLGISPQVACGQTRTAQGAAFDPSIAADFAAAVDFSSMHYFLSERTFGEDLQALRAGVGAMPIVLEEFGLHTLASPPTPCLAQVSCDDPHTESEQAAYYNTLLSSAEAGGAAGFIFWTLNDYSYILDPPYANHCLGILRNSLAAMCQDASPADYGEKPAAVAVGQHFQPRRAYLDLFDGWVDPKTDLPPLGWADNASAGGALLRDYNTANSLWSQSQGRVAITKVVSNTLSVPGVALSPVITDALVDDFPLLSVRVSGYAIRDPQNGSDATLQIGVSESGRITNLLTITPQTTLPATLTANLRQAPLGWQGAHSFQIVLTLTPQASLSGYSAAYELDSLELLGDRRAYLPQVAR